MNEIAAVPEITKQQLVDVKYEIDPKNSLFQFDGNALGEALIQIGYSPNILRPLVIDSDPLTPHVLARYDAIRRSVIIHNNSFLNTVKQVYDMALETMGEKPEIKDEEGLLQKITDSTFRLVFPVFWPYRMIKNNYTDFYAGKPERMINYLKAAKDGTLMPGKPLEEQRARAKSFINKLTEKATKRYVGWTIAHEYEHIQDHGRKLALKTALGVGAAVATVALLDILIEQDPVSPASKVLLQLMLGSLTGFGGLSIGRASEENTSNKAGFKNMAKVMQCFKINHEIFAREILGEQG